MLKEIGSEFWINELPKEDKRCSPDWLNDWGNHILTSSGSGAISLMLEQVEQRVKTKTALLPAYTCESVVIPFIEEGYTCYFYDINENLKPNLDSIDFFDNVDIGIFLHMGYYGFPTNINLNDTVKKLKKNNVIIIEDITHTLFSEYIRFEENDYYLASLRKWFGIPSGGVLIYGNEEIEDNLYIHNEYVNIRKKALLLKGNFIKTGNLELKKQFLDLFMKAELILEKDISPYAIDGTSIALLNEIEVKELVKARKDNYSFLLENLEDELVNFVFKDLSIGVCPMFFPIYVKNDRNDFKAKLIENHIYSPIHWPIPNYLDISNFHNSKKIYESIISIPCDQRYSIKDMERIVKNIKDI